MHTNTTTAVIFIQRHILQAVWYFWCKPLKTLMSKMLAHVGWMDFHTKQILPERFHAETLFYHSHISHIKGIHTQTHTCIHTHTHNHAQRNKHAFREHFTSLEVAYCRHGALCACYSVFSGYLWFGYNSFLKAKA